MLLFIVADEEFQHRPNELENKFVYIFKTKQTHTFHNEMNVQLSDAYSDVKI